MFKFKNFYYLIGLLAGFIVCIGLLRSFLLVNEGGEVKVSASPMPFKRPLYLVFASSEKYLGSLGGLYGADQKCQALAMDAGLPGVFIAWLSSADSLALDRLPDAGFVLLNDRKVVLSKFDLVSGKNLLTGINMTEKGEELTGYEPVWTGTGKDGSLTKTCYNWMGGDNVAKGGVAGEIDLNWTDSWQTSSCGDFKARLYCFQVERPLVPESF
jgi:hypothetical protein